MWLCAAPILYPFPVRVLTAKNNSHYLLITLTFYQRWVAGVHVPQLEDSCQSASQAWRGVERGLEEQAPKIQPCRKKGLLCELPRCPHAPAPSRPNRVGPDRGSAPPPQLSCPQKTGQDNHWHLPSYPTPGPETHRFKQTTQDNGLETHADVWSMSHCSSRSELKVELLALQTSATTVIVLDSVWAVYLCISMNIHRSGSVGPAALFSLQLSYVLFMLSVECPALPGHWHGWQCQTEDNKSGCQLALQDLAVDSVWWPQSEMISALPAGLWGDLQTSIALPSG